MDRAKIDSLVRRLVDNPHDEEALDSAHQAGEADPKSYAMMLERIGTETKDPAYAAHWLAEAGNVWSTTLGDAHRAARVLMMAIDKDPAAPTAAERLAQLYRDKGDSKALVALLDRRVRALTPLAAQAPELRGELAGMHEELGRLWSEPPLLQRKKAIDAFKKAIELDPTSAYAIYSAREVYKQLEDWQSAIPLYASELELETDPDRRVSLLRDEAATRKLAGDLHGASRALASALEISASDLALQQEYASSILDRIQAGEAVPAADRISAAELLVLLAETYEGEHGLAYAAAALDIDPGSDRAMQLFSHYARTLSQPNDLLARHSAYLAAKPNGAMAAEIRATLALTGSRAASAPSNAHHSHNPNASAAPSTDHSTGLPTAAAAGPTASVTNDRRSSEQLSSSSELREAHGSSSEPKVPTASTPRPSSPSTPSVVAAAAAATSTTTDATEPAASSTSVADDKLRERAPSEPRVEPRVRSSEPKVASASSFSASLSTTPTTRPSTDKDKADKDKTAATSSGAAAATAPAAPTATAATKATIPTTERKRDTAQRVNGQRVNGQRDGEISATKRVSMTPGKLQSLLEAAQGLARKGKKPEAYAKYKEVLEAEPAHPEALCWTEDYLRSKRDYGQLRDVLLACIRATAGLPDQQELRKGRLREVAGLCEGNLRDTDGAISAWRQLLAADRSDESARTALMRLLERSQRWDELAKLLEQEAATESDVDTKVHLERKLARVQEDKRQELAAAGEAWRRISRLLGDDDQSALTASRLFEKGERLDLAAAVLAESAAGISDPAARGQVLRRLAELREQLGDATLAGDSYAEAADVLRSGKLWEEAERLYLSVESWEAAANAASERGLLTGDHKQEASLLVRASDYLTKAGRGADALERLEQATNLDPLNDDYAALLVARYDADRQIDKLVRFLTRRGDRLTDRSKRVSIRREAATLSGTRLADKELARDLWLKLLEDGDDREALERLIDDAVERDDHTEAVTLLRRLGQNTVDTTEKARIALREAELLANGIGDVDTAISRYELILSDLDSTCRPALQAIANLQETGGHRAEAANALERELDLVADVQDRGQIAGRLARLYEALADRHNAIRALDLVRKADPEDFDALKRLCELCESTELWARVAELLAERIEIEGEEQEVAALTKKLASVLADKLDRGDEALSALTELADSGEASVRAAYIELGDRLGWKGIVASKLKEWWFDARHGVERTAALRGAFERFSEVGRDADAVTVAIELIRAKGADMKLADHLEELSVKTGDHDALTIAHDLLTREAHGEARAHELVRQAEIRAHAGMPKADAIWHGEQGLPLIAPAEAEPLLERLAALAATPTEVIDIYERQVGRAKTPADRIGALARAAQVASLRGEADRARTFFELGLSGAPTEETLSVLEASAREGDKLGDGDRLRRALCQALAAGGHGARDGGRTRANLLCRAATIAHNDLNDVDQAFTWLADALVAHVDSLTLDLLESFGTASGDPRRAEAALTQALGEVFDEPLVKQLLARRAKIRREHLGEPMNAAADLKKLLDLSPTDQAVMDDLSSLLMDLSDYKSLVQLYEDQILRSKDMNARAELARKVARIWEEQLTDVRETADAWRRVARMRPDDAEAASSLERVKMGAQALKKAEGDPKVVYAPPRLVSEQPILPPQRHASKPLAAPHPATRITTASPGKAMLSRVTSPPDSTKTSTPLPMHAVRTTSSSIDPASRRAAPPPLPSESISRRGGDPLHKLPNDVSTTLAAIDAPEGFSGSSSTTDSQLDGDVDSLFDHAGDVLGTTSPRNALADSPLETSDDTSSGEGWSAVAHAGTAAAARAEERDAGGDVLDANDAKNEREASAASRAPEGSQPALAHHQDDDEIVIVDDFAEFVDDAKDDKAKDDNARVTTLPSDE
ncbi:MAG: hypothetical protein FWD73_13275 [Polyangiaceae bacterium]|nr:hypothetical protein [Polyangiaceae bacterium]